MLKKSLYYSHLYAVGSDYAITQTTTLWMHLCGPIVGLVTHGVLIRSNFIKWVMKWSEWMFVNIKAHEVIATSGSGIIAIKVERGPKQRSTIFYISLSSTLRSTVLRKVREILYLTTFSSDKKTIRETLMHLNATLTVFYPIIWIPR